MNQQKTESDIEKANRMQNEKEQLNQTKSRIAQLCMQLNDLLVPGATVAVNIKTSKIITESNPNPRDICIVVSKPVALEGINIDLVPQSETKASEKRGE